MVSSSLGQCDCSHSTFCDRHTATLEHPPYLPDLVLCDFFLLPKVKSVLKGTCFESCDAIKKKTAALKTVDRKWSALCLQLLENKTAFVYECGLRLY